ncbi:hypothetical protein NPIL_298751 [Nephila pilipes]|uniref:Uncharacterized protein n=1 Tax=Nephila pilipes TaxID=299642 RepID=A0A8X6QJC6_NEPPI|nr:hypothetical protein NPIL_298751 [Nephila pilipes]
MVLERKRLMICHGEDNLARHKNQFSSRTPSCLPTFTQSGRPAAPFLPPFYAFCRGRGEGRTHLPFVSKVTHGFFVARQCHENQSYVNDIDSALPQSR